MMIWQHMPAVTGALMERDCFLLSWNCCWLLFKMQHYVQASLLATRRGFIKTQLVFQGRRIYFHRFVHHGIVVVLIATAMVLFE